MQVKLRGYRIELSEIESLITKFGDVQAVAVTVVAIPDGIEEFVAYMIPKPDHNINIVHLHDRLQHCLPTYMVLAYIEKIAEFPVFPSGKIDRKALPKTNLTRLGSNKLFVAPLGEMETIVSEVWRNMLHMSQISAIDDFFLDLGGHSLLAANVVSKLRGYPEFINLSMADFYANPTVQKLSLLAARAKSINEPSKVELPKEATFESNIYLKTIIIQSLGLYMFFGLPGLILTGWHYFSKSMTEVNIFQNNAFLYNLRIDSIYYSYWAVFIHIVHIYLDPHRSYSKKVAYRPIHPRTASPMGQLLSALVVG